MHLPSYLVRALLDKRRQRTCKDAITNEYTVSIRTRTHLKHTRLTHYKWTIYADCAQLRHHDAIPFLYGIVRTIPGLTYMYMHSMVTVHSGQVTYRLGQAQPIAP